MPRRLKLTLVYFGLVEDPELETYLDQRPMNAWRVAAVTIFLVLVAVVVLGVLLGLDKIAGWLSSAAIGLAAGFLFRGSQRRRSRRQADHER